MTVAAILRHKGNAVETVAPGTGAAEIAQRLTAHRIGALLVCEHDRPVGIVSERDLVRAIAREGAEALRRNAAQLMTSVLHTVTPATTEAEVMARMTESRIRHLPVLEDGRLVGLISIGDVVKARMDEQSQEVDSLKAYVAGN